MKILVVNGSPKGKYSITLQTSLYLEKLHPEHNFTVLNAGQTIKALENDFSEASCLLADAELILFSYPVYTFLAPSQLHRFIELTKESGIDLSGKYAAQISTSKHFYDVTAHAYIKDNCFDMGLKYLCGLSADMDDLLSDKGQMNARDFFDYMIWCAESDIYELPTDAPSKFVPVPASARARVSELVKLRGRVVIVADTDDSNTTLNSMIERFRSSLPYKTEIVNIRDFPFAGGCISCFNCSTDGKCLYKDGFDDYLRNNIQSADAIVIAFSIKDHSMGSRFKMYDDRQFCNGHRTVTMGKPFAYIIDGAYSREDNLRTVIEARADVGGNYLAGVVSNEKDTDASSDRVSARLIYSIEHNYDPPQSFWGVGGMKIFRDLIWLMQGMMKADHKFYKEHGQYDFPQKKRGTMIKMYLVGALMSSKKLRSVAGKKMNDGMLSPYRKVISAAKPISKSSPKKK